MKTQDIRNMGLAYLQVQEKAKMDPVDKKALKKDFDDREDKDIDNDGDVDKSDEYLHKRRKAISKSSKNPSETETVEAKEEVQMESKRPIFKRIMEKRDMHVKGATPPEPMDSKASGLEKDFVAKHGGLDGNDSGIDGAKAAADTAKAATAQVKVAPGRPNDNKAGDKTQPKGN